jgi:hypothetical protein
MNIRLKQKNHRIVSFFPNDAFFPPDRQKNKKNLPWVDGLAGRVVDGVGGSHGGQGAGAAPCAPPSSRHPAQNVVN